MRLVRSIAVIAALWEAAFWVSAYAQDIAPAEEDVAPSAEEDVAPAEEDLAQSDASLAGEAAAAMTAPAVTPAPRQTPRPGAAWEHRLSNGLHIVGREDPRQAVSVMCISYDAGATRDPEGLSGLALLTTRLHYAGITPRFHDGIATHLPESTARLRMDSATLCIPVVDADLEHALHAESERMAFLLRSLREEHVQAEVDLLLQSSWSMPFVERNVQPNAMEALHGNSRRFANDEGLRNITLAHVQWFHQTYYSPTNAVLSIVSSRPHAEVIELAERYFAHVRGAPAPEAHVCERPSLGESTRIDITGSRPRHVALYWVTPCYLSEGDEALDLVAGHLRRRLRQELGGAAQNIDVRQLSSIERSAFVVRVDAADNVDLDALQRRLEVAVQEVGETRLTEEELRAARNTAVLREPGAFEHAITLATHSQYFGVLTPVGTRQARLDSLTPSEVRNAAARSLRGHFVAVIYRHAQQRESVLVRRVP